MTSPQMKQRILQVHRRAMNARLQKIGVAPLSTCGGNAGEPYVIDVKRGVVVPTGQQMAEIDVRFPNCPADELWDPDLDVDTFAVWRIGLTISRDGRPVRLNPGGIGVTTQCAEFSGMIHYGQSGAMHWHIAWAATFKDRAAATKPSEQKKSSGWRDPGKGGFNYL